MRIRQRLGAETSMPWRRLTPLMLAAVKVPGDLGLETNPLISSLSQAWKNVTSIVALSFRNFCSTPASQLMEVSGRRSGLPTKGANPPVPKPNCSIKDGF